MECCPQWAPEQPWMGCSASAVVLQDVLRRDTGLREALSSIRELAAAVWSSLMALMSNNTLSYQDVLEAFEESQDHQQAVIRSGTQPDVHLDHVHVQASSCSRRHSCSLSNSCYHGSLVLSRR